MAGVRTQLRATLQLDRLWQFGLVGLLGTGCDYAVLGLLHYVANVDLVVAKVAAAEVAIVVMFAINEVWTFAEWGADTWPSRFRRLLKSNLVRLGGIVVATVVLVVLNDRYGVSVPIANAVGIGAGFFVNYTLENLLTWRTHR